MDAILLAGSQGPLLAMSTENPIVNQVWLRALIFSRAPSGRPHHLGLSENRLKQIFFIVYVCVCVSNFKTASSEF